MAAVMLHLIPSFLANYSKNTLFISNTYEKQIVTKEYCISHQGAELWFLLNCRHHIYMLGNDGELLHKVDPLCSTYQLADCLYTIFKYRLSGNFVAKSGLVFDIAERAVNFKQKTRGVDKLPGKKDPLGKGAQSIHWKLSNSQNQRKPVNRSWQKNWTS